MTKKDFEAVASAIKSAVETCGVNTVTADVNARRFAAHVVGELADRFVAANPRFDRSRFLAACGLAVKP